jgi:hypothetical protein
LLLAAVSDTAPCWVLLPPLLLVLLLSAQPDSTWFIAAGTALPTASATAWLTASAIELLLTPGAAWRMASRAASLVASDTAWLMAAALGAALSICAQKEIGGQRSLAMLLLAGCCAHA